MQLQCIFACSDHANACGIIVNGLMKTTFNTYTARPVCWHEWDLLTVTVA